jgi:diacylglycerol kinase (ATP)
MRQNYLVIVNPVSGKRTGLKLEERIKRVLSRKKISFKVFRTAHAGHAVELVSGLGRRFTDIVSVGGDGTLNEVVNGLKGASANIGIVPAGSGNDFIKNLDIPSGLDDRIASALFGRTKRIDTGICNGRVFVNGVGIGFDGHVVDVMRKGGFSVLPGRLRYIFTVLSLLLGYREVPLRTVIDRKIENRKLFLLTVGNGTTFGGGYKLCPGAKLDDGFFDVCTIDPLPVLRRFIKVPLTESGRHLGLPEVRITRCKTLELSSAFPLPAHIDGDFAGYGPYKIVLKSSSLLIRASLPDRK